MIYLHYPKSYQHKLFHSFADHTHIHAHAIRSETSVSTNTDPIVSEKAGHGNRGGRSTDNRHTIALDDNASFEYVRETSHNMSDQCC